MRTARLLTISGGGGVCLPGGVFQTPPSPCEQNDWHTGVKTPPPNYLVDGKNSPNHSDNNSERFQMNGENSFGHSWHAYKSVVKLRKMLKEKPI